jgi:hypothetical protein
VAGVDPISTLAPEKGVTVKDNEGKVIVKGSDYPSGNIYRKDLEIPSMKARQINTADSAPNA